jgi:large subunit ribosomal protein L35
MPKMKTNRGAAKRLKRTAKGRFKRWKANHSHILTKKDRKRKRRLRDSDMISDADQQRMRRLLPYSG